MDQIQVYIYQVTYQFGVLIIVFHISTHRLNGVKLHIHVFKFTSYTVLGMSSYSGRRWTSIRPKTTLPCICRDTCVCQQQPRLKSVCELHMHINIIKKSKTTHWPSLADRWPSTLAVTRSGPVSPSSSSSSPSSAGSTRDRGGSDRNTKIDFSVFSNIEVCEGIFSNFHHDKIELY